MKASTVTMALDKQGLLTWHIRAPAEWYDLLKRGHPIPLELPEKALVKQERVHIVLVPEEEGA